MSIYFAPKIMLGVFSCFNSKVNPHNTPKSKAAYYITITYPILQKKKTVAHM